jgi:GT2 family glycosyltransferase
MIDPCSTRGDDVMSERPAETTRTGAAFRDVEGGSVPDPDCSIVVPCVFIGRLVERCVRECARRCPGAEILVIVDDPDDDAKLGRLASVIVSGPCTIAAKRNLAARRSRAEYLAFIDSDAYPAEGWPENAIRRLEDDPTVGIIGGPNVSPPEQTRSELYVGLALKSTLVSGKKAYLKRVVSARFVEDLPACNMVLRRRDFLDAGGMDETLFTAEDIAFCTELRKRGQKILYSPDVLVFHKNRNLRSFLNQRLAYGACLEILYFLARNRLFSIILIRLMPALFFLFLLSAPMTLLWSPWGWIYGGVILVSLLVFSGEAIRHAERWSDVPGTFVALLIGNLGLGAGTVAEPLGLLPDLRELYRNYT